MMPKRKLDLTDSEASDSEEDVACFQPKRRKLTTKSANIDTTTQTIDSVFLSMKLNTIFLLLSEKGVFLSNKVRLPWVGYGTYQVKKAEYKDLLIHAMEEQKCPLIDTASR